MNLIKSKYSLSSNEKIIIKISENENDDLDSSASPTKDYNYEFFLENGTKLEINDIEEGINIDVYVPITDLDLAKFDIAKKFAEKGYDIYDINSAFYTDFCTPASINGNDITLEDRKKDIYPKNITLCKSNCVYKGINYEERRVICSCNLNSDINKTNSNQEDNEDFVTYFIDYINYRLFLCYKLFFNKYNLAHSYAFFIILAIFIIIQIINIIYLKYSLQKLKEFFINETPLKDKLNKEIISELISFNDSNHSNIISNPKKKKKGKDKNSDGEKLNERTRNKKKPKGKIKSKSEKILLFNALKSDNYNIQSEEELTGKNTDNKIKETAIRNNEEIVNKENNINELPFSKAIKVDQRNIFIMFYSFLIEKLDIISIICTDDKLKIIIIEEYILSLLINFFFNALLYSDDVVSNKYHNNGELDFIVSLILSILSNVVTSFIAYYINYSKGIEERINLILEMKNNLPYFRNIKRILSYLKYKFICFFISQIIIIATCIYYVVIFCVKYRYSQISLVVNYCYSFIESIITSFAITTLILITRKIGLSCSNKEFYNASKYINNKF